MTKGHSCRIKGKLQLPAAQEHVYAQEIEKILELSF